jgi:tetratricopeptide (TPR) repeat protein
VLSSRHLLLLLPALLAAPLAADDHWIALRSGPFEVYSNAGEKPARERLNQLEQFRETMRIITGKDEMRLVWPIRVVVSKSAPADAKPFALGRDARMVAVSESGFSRDTLKELARLLLRDNTNKLPPDVEQGIIDLVSTVQIEGVRITLGAPVPEGERSTGWALMHLVTVTPEYAGRTRVMISNLEQTNDFDAACHNAFEKSGAQIREQVEAYLKAGNFPTASLSGRALAAARDFKPILLGSEDVRFVLADLQLASGHTAEAATAYMALHGPAASEGLAFVALHDQKDDDAAKAFMDAIESGSKNARAWVELGTSKGDADLLKRGSVLNPRWGEPYYQLADLDAAVDKPQLEQRATLLKKACALNPRNMDYWTALAKTYEAAKDFAEAQKAWSGAERSAANDQERERIAKVRLDVQAKRFDYEASERKHIHDDEAADLARVKAKSDAEIHAAEVAARKRMNPNGQAPPKPEAWYQAPVASGSSVEGVFQKLECLSGAARMVIQTLDGKTVQLLMGDPSQISVGGGGAEQTLACGAQKNPRNVLVHYNPKPDTKLHTAGEVTTIEFH